MSDLIIDWENGLVWFDCPRCSGYGIDPVRVGIGDERPCDPDCCNDCGGMMQTVVDVRVFAANLATAGALCAAWVMGRDYGESPRLMRDDEWEPNTIGDAAPGLDGCGRGWG